MTANNISIMQMPVRKNSSSAVLHRKITCVNSVIFVASNVELMKILKWSASINERWSFSISIYFNLCTIQMSYGDWNRSVRFHRHKTDRCLMDWIQHNTIYSVCANAFRMLATSWIQVVQLTNFRHWISFIEMLICSAMINALPTNAEKKNDEENDINIFTCT